MKIGGREVDFVLKKGRSLAAREVKSGKEGDVLSGTDEFSKAFRPKKLLLIGAGGISLIRFLSESIMKWID